MSLVTKRDTYCSTQTKLLSFGFVRRFESTYNLLIPLLIYHLCLLYFNSDDLWNEQCCLNQLFIADKEIYKLENNDWNNSVWLKNLIVDGIYRWIFKINMLSIKDGIQQQYTETWCQFHIGIWEASTANFYESIIKQPKEWNDYAKSYLIDVRTGDAIESWIPYCLMLSSHHFYAWSDHNENNYQYTIKSGDCLSITLNMNTLTVMFEHITQKMHIKTFNIDNKPYHAGAIIGHPTYSIKLIQSGYI